MPSRLKFFPPPFCSAYRLSCLLVSACLETWMKVEGWGGDGGTCDALTGKMAA